MSFPTPGTTVPGGTGTYQVQPLQSVLDSFSRQGLANHSFMIRWLSRATRIARNNGGNIATLVIPPNVALNRPEIVLFGNFGNSADRQRAELIDQFLSSPNPAITAILEPFTRSRTVRIDGVLTTVPPQSIFLALASFDQSIPGSPNSVVMGLGDFFSPTDGEFEVILNTVEPIDTPRGRAQFLLYLIHELDHRNGTHRSLRIRADDVRITSRASFDSFFGRWTPDAIVGTNNAGPGYRLSDPHYSRAFTQWDNARAALNINISAADRTAIINNDNAAYNERELHNMRQSLWVVFQDQIRNHVPGTPSYFLDQPGIIQLMVARGAIRLRRGAPANSTNPADYRQVRSVEKEENRLIEAREKAEDRYRQQLARMHSRLRKFYERQGMPEAEIQERLSRIAQSMLDSPDDPDAEETRLAIFADDRLAMEDEVYLMQLKQQAGYGAVFGSTLGALIAGDNVVARTISSAFFETIGTELLEVILNNGPIVTLPSGGEVSVFENMGADFLSNLKKAGIGAVSSFLTAKLVEALGVEGFAGEALDTVAGVVINDILTNIASLNNPFSNIASTTSIATAAAAFLGTKLAQEIHSFKSIGGQIGAALGSALFAFDAGLFLAAFGVTPVTFALAVVWVAIGTLLGGSIGSLFGGTPRSGADAQWDAEAGRFVVANVYARKGGSKSAASSLAGAAADSYNAVLALTGATLMDPKAVPAGNYGMRGSTYVYRPISTRDKSAITQRFTGKDAADKLLKYGVYAGLSTGFELAGGNVYAKRGLTGNLALTASWQNFDFAGTVNDIRTAIEYGNYLADKLTVSLLMAVDPTSAFTIGWLATLARAEELGVDRRSRSDWNGGFNLLLDDTFGMNAANVELLLLPTIPGKLERVMAFYDENNEQLGMAGDTIDTSRTTLIDGTSGNDVITLTHHAKAITRGGNLVSFDGWPTAGRDRVGGNVIELAGWPRDPSNLPGGGATLAGWQNPSAYLDETQWIAGTDPRGGEATLMRAGQVDASPEGGGNVTNAAAIDPLKAYQFTYYFQLTDIGRHALHFGLGGAAVQNLATGAADADPYFIQISTAEQLSLQAAGKLTVGEWYRVTGYVLPSNAATVASAELGGVYSVETDEKIAHNEANYRWDPTVPASGASAHSRFFNFGGASSPGWSTNFYQPEMREIDSTAYAPQGLALPQGWQNLGGVTDETRWAATSGPEGRPVVALLAGQTDSSPEGGGAHTNEVTIDGELAYEFTYYFKKTDLTKHSIYFGLDGASPAYVENAATGNDVEDPYFVAMDVAAQQAVLQNDRWYKVVGYVLAEGAALPPAGTLGGVFDTVTGDKVASATTFRWNPGRADNSVHARFFDYHNQDQAPGYSTYFYRPEIRETDEQLVVGGADRLISTAGLRINGMQGDGFGFSIPVAATIDAGDGDDLVHAGDMGNNVLGGAGIDRLYGGRLDDWLLGGDGDDSLNAGSANAGTLGGDGNYLDGGDGDDLLIGREGSDWLEGGMGTDVLEGGDGGDILAGGAGRADILRGGRGDDQYLFRIGDVASAVAGDADVVRDESGLSVETIVTQAYNDFSPGEISDLVDDAFSGELFRVGRGLNNWRGGGVQVTLAGRAAGGEDALVLGAGIGLEDIKILKSDDSMDLIVELWPDGIFAGDRIILDDWFSSFNKVETIKFADGNEVRIADFDTFILGTDGSETIVGTAGNDFVHAGAGTDVVFLLSGNDFGNGGLGNDTVAGDSGSDIVLGADGDDTLHGGSGVDTVSGGRGADTVHGDDGNDIVAGGAGNDEVVGGSGDDVFKFARGDGQDIFIDALSDEWEVAWVSGPGWQNGYVLNADGTISHPVSGVLFDGTVWLARTRYEVETGTLWRHKPANSNAIVADMGTDTIEFGVGIDLNDVQISRANSDKDLILGIEPAGSPGIAFAALEDRITLKEWGPSGNASARGSIESLVFFNTGAIDLTTMRLNGGGDGDDTLGSVAGSANWLTGGSGNDQLTGDTLGDILNGNSGDDRLLGLGGADALLGGAGNDVLIGGAGTAEAGDKLVGGVGTDIASYETATAAVRASLAQPKAANDATAGEAAGDIYDSIEALRGSNFADDLEGDEADNTFEGGKGNDVVRGGLGDDLYVFGRGDGVDSIEDQYAPAKDVVVDSGGALERPWVARMELMKREEGLYYFDHVVVHSETGEIAYRRSLAPTANRELAMPADFEGDGWVAGGQGSAVFTETGSGDEVAEVAAEGPGGSDTLLFEDYTGLAGYTGEQTIGLGDLLFAFDTVPANVNDLLISLVGSPADKVRIKGFRNGAAVNLNSVIEKIQFSDGSSIRLEGLKFDSNGTLLVASTDTQIAPVDDLLIGTAVDDLLTGGYGDDALSGGAGNDWLQGGDGDDQLSGSTGYDILHGGEGIDTATYLGADGGVGVTINLSNGSPGSGGEASGDNFNSIENIVGTQFNDTVTGDTKDNVLKGNRGNDTLTGGLGADVLLGDDGTDTLTGNVHDDALDGGAGNDTLNGGGDRDVLSGGDGNDILRADGVSGNETGGNLVVNFSFEDSGSAGDDSAQSYGLTTEDLPGWKLAEARPVPLTTSASGVNPSLGTRSIHLDDGTGNVEISQVIGGYTARESLSLLLSSAGRTTGASSSFQVLWNDQVVITVASGTSTWTTRSASLTAIEGNNKLTIRGTGDVDGLGALIDNVRLTRSMGAADQLLGGAGVDRLEGGSGNDVLQGGDGNDSSTQVVTGSTMGGLYGGSGDDLLDGGAGDDSLDGGAGVDRYVFRTGSGNDTLAPVIGADELAFEGMSWDRLWFSQPTSTQDLLITAIGGGASVRMTNWFSAPASRARRILVGDKMLSRFDMQALVTAMAAESPAVPALWPATPSQAFTDALAAAWQDATAYVDRAVVTGTSGNDYLYTEYNWVDYVKVDVWAGPVRFEGLAGNDILEGLGGDDILIGGAGNDTMYGGVGDDEFQFGVETGFDTVQGNDGIDVLVATADSARFYLQSLAGVEAISGEGFADVQIFLNPGYGLDLTTVAVDGVTQINGSASDETIFGSAGADRIFGDAGDDTLTGGAGDDWIQGGDGADQLDGGEGTDTLDQSSSAADQSIDLAAGEILADSIWEQVLNFENAVGGSGADTITGTLATNRLDGNGGNDTLEGAGGNDVLIGGAGTDALRGGAGSDTASYETQAAASTTTSEADGVTLDGVVANLATNSSANGTPPSLLNRAKQGDAAGDWFYQIENLRGSSFNDKLTGNDADNELAGGAGRDLLYGALGLDTAVYAGNRDDYEIVTGSVYTVRDLNAADGDEGLDDLHDIEHVRFADMTVNLGIDGNNAPYLGVPAMADQIWQDGVTTTYQVPSNAFLDLDNDPLTFAASLANNAALPSWLGWNAATRTFSGAAPFASIGTVLEVKVTASDASASVSDTFLLSVGEAPGPDVVGTSGADTLAGTVRAETMIGLAGNDILLGSPGADRLDGGADLDQADYSASNAGVTIVLGTALVIGSGGHAQGDQLISIEKALGSAYGDTITGAADANELFGGAGNDTIDGGDGDDLIDGGTGTDTLSGGAGNDSIQTVALASGALEDSIDAGTGNDTIYLSASVNAATIDLSALVGVEHVTGSDLGDTIGGNGLGNILSGGLGNDALSGAGGIDTLSGGGDNDSIQGGDGNDLLYGDAGDDWLQGGAGGDTFYGGTGVDTADYRASVGGITVDLSGGTATGGDAAGDSFLGSQVENIDATDAADILTGTTGGNVMKGFAGNDTINGGAGNDTLLGGTQNDTLYGGTEDDSLSGEDGDDILYGEAGIDNLSGGLGNDTLEGGLGADIVTGGDGDDLVVIAIDAADTVDGGAGTDTASYAAVSGWLTIDLNSTTDNLSNIENLTAGSGTDTLTGSALANVLRGGGGGDTVHGGAGNDTLYGDSGADTLRGDAGADTIYGGTENDTLYGGTEDDVLSGEDGNDILYGEAGIDNLSGGLGHDTLEGGLGLDTVAGGDGDDTVILTSDGLDTVDGGAGTDTASYAAFATAVTVDLTSATDNLTSIENLTGGSGADSLTGSSAANRLDGGAGDDMLNGSGGADVLIGGSGVDTATFAASAAGTGFSSGSIGGLVINSVTLVDAVVRTLTGVDADLAAGTGANADAAGDTYSGIENLVGSANADRLRASSVAASISGGLGDDVIHGGAGNDILHGNGGDDIVYGGTGVDSLYGDDGADRLFGGVGNSSLYGGEGNDTLAEEAGGTGLDVFDGGGGDDTMHGSAGADTYDGGSGTDSIGFRVSTAAVRVNLSSVTVNGLLAGRGGGGDAEGDIYVGASIENLGGSAFNDELTGNASVNLIGGNAGDDIVRGDGGDDGLWGEAGNDTLYGDAGADGLYGGTENDTLYGGIGNDILSGGDGNDIHYGEAGIDNLSGGLGDDDFHLLVVGEDVVDGGDGADRALFTASTANLIIDLNLAAHKLTAIEEVLTGSGHDDVKGSSSANRLDGGAGDDTLEGRGGADILVGGSGTDTASYAGSLAGTGFSSGSIGGSVAGGVTLVVAVTRTLTGVDVNLAAGTGANADAAGDTLSGIENLVGSAVADRLRGSSSNTIVSGGAGDDVIYGGGGNDTLHGDAGHDILYGEAGVDSLHGGDGDDRLFGGVGASSLYGGNDNDILGEEAGSGQDLFDGGAGDDQLLGSAEGDTYDGGTGIDTLDFRGSAAAVRVNLSAVAVNGVAANRGAGGDADLDTYVAGTIENVRGSAFNDELSGNSLANILTGGDGDDTFIGGGGADHFDGGAGTDKVSYAMAAAVPAGTEVDSDPVGGISMPGYELPARVISLTGMRVNLQANSGAGGEAAGDTFASVDNLIGSASSDQLTGTDAVDGVGGINRIEGGAGDDLIYGGSGNDKLFGDADNDVIYGQDGEDEIWGGLGDDRLFGEGDPDELHGEDGIDVLHAGDEGDRLYGGADADTLIGGDGGDTYYYNAGDDDDTIHNYDVTVGARDVVNFGTIQNTNLWFAKVDNDLVVSLIGSTTDSLTVADWFIDNEPESWEPNGPFVVNVFIAQQWVERDVNVPLLLELTKDVGKPDVYTDLDPTLRAQIEATWDLDAPPAVAASINNQSTTVEGSPIVLHYSVTDGESAVSGLGLTATIHDQIGPIPVFNTIVPASHIAWVSDNGNTRTYRLTLNPVQYAHGESTIRVTGNDDVPFTTDLDVNIRVLAKADPVDVTGPVIAAGNVNTAIMLPGSQSGKLAVIRDTNSEIFDYVRIEAVPVGAVLSDGAFSFTSTAGATTAEVKTWNLGALRITPPTGSSADFTLTLRARSKEDLDPSEIAAGQQFGPESSTTIQVNVNGTPTAVTLAYAVPLFLENVAGAIVGTLGNTDPGDPTGVYTYKIVGGADAAKFVDPNDAAGVTQLRLAAGQSLNYEAGDANIIVRVTDRTIASSPVTFQQTLGIRPADVNEQPSLPSDSNAAANIVAEGATPGTGTGITALSTDPEGAAVVYTMASDPMSWFAVNSTTGVVTVRAGAAVDYEATAAGTASITVQASDGTTTPVTSNFVINITDLNEAPLITSAATANMFENVAAGTVVSTITSSDPDRDHLAIGEAGHLYTITGGTGSALFEIVGSQIRTKAGTTFNYETGPTSYSLALRVTDGGGLTSNQTLTINLQNVNEAPSAITDSNAAANMVTEGAGPGTAAGITLFSSDPEGTALTYSITSDPFNWFAVNSTSGVVTVRSGANVDYEATANGTATIGVRVTDGVNAVTSSFVVNITNVNEPPTPIVDSNAAANAVTENAAGGAATGITLLSTNPEGTALTYSITSDPYNWFAVNATTGVVTVRSGALVDFEATANGTATIGVGATDGVHTVTSSFVITINNVNEAPGPLTDNNGAANVVGDGATAGTGTGITLFAPDPEGGVTYTLTHDPFEWFAVHPTTGVVTVRSNATVQYESAANGTVAINVKASDGVNPDVPLSSLVVTITDVNETPWFTSAMSAPLGETTGGGGLVATLTAEDWDLNTVAFGELGHVYSVTGGSGASLFEIVGNQIKTRSGAAFDWDAGPRTYTLSIRVRDNYDAGLYDDDTFTINIEPVDEAPSAPAAITDRYVNENAAFSVALSGSVDPEALEVDYEFNLATAGNPGGLFAIDNAGGNGGTLRLDLPVNFETIRNQPYYTAESAHRGYVDVRVLATDPAFNRSAERVIRVHFDNVNDITPAAPVLSSWGTTTFAENSGAGAVVATFTAPSDGDGTLNALGYELTTNDGGMFEIVGNQVRVITTAHFNYEAFATGGPSTLINVGLRTTDGANVSGIYSFNVQVNNVDDNLPVAGGVTMQNGYGSTIYENTVTPTNGLVIARAQASDPDGDGITYSIVAGNVASAFTIDSNGYIAAPNGLDYEAMGGGSTLAADPPVAINLTIRAAQTTNGGRYVDQVLSFNVGDLQELVGVFDPAQSYPASPGAPTGSGLNTFYTLSLPNNFLFYYRHQIIFQSGNVYDTRTIALDNNLNGVIDAPDTVVYDFYMTNGTINTLTTATGYSWIEGSGYGTSGNATGRFVKNLPPIVLDLSGAGDFSSSVTAQFDVDRDGITDNVAWISGEQGFLVLDRNGNGIIDDGSELSFVGDLPGATTDLEGLRAYDSNEDGLFDGQDARFGEFRIWQDSDEDGVTDEGELRSLDDVGIATIDLAIIKSDMLAPDTASQAVLGTSTFGWADGRSGMVGDIALRWDSTPSSAAQSLANSSAMPLPSAAVIAIDRDGNGVIDPTTEVAGAGLPLSGFDSNGDALISPLDAAYYDLRLWTDENGNDRAEPDEISSLDRAGLTAISTTAVADPSPATQPEAPQAAAGPSAPAVPDPSPAPPPQAAAPAAEAPAQPVPDPSPAAQPQAPEPAAGASAGAAGREDDRRFRAMLSGLGALRGRHRTDSLIEAAAAAEAGSPLQSRMVQAMASFGARGAAEITARDPVSPHVFLHAAS